MTNENTVSLRGPVTTFSVSQVTEQLLSKSGESDLYLYLSTPGGSVVDGYQLVQVIDTLYRNGVTVHCVADVAISMGFVIFQSCPERHVRASTILMQHQMSFGTRGPIEHVKNYVDFVNHMESEILVRQANRLGMTPEQFKQKTVSDWWTYGHETMNQNLADSMVLVSCSEEMTHMNDTVKVMSFFGPVNVVFNRCPLISAPKKIEFARSLQLDQGKASAVTNFDRENRRIAAMFDVQRIPTVGGSFQDYLDYITETPEVSEPMDYF